MMWTRIIPGMHNVGRLLLPLLLLVFCLPAPARADIGLPMIIPMRFLMIVALLPIIGVEAWVLAVRLDITIGVALAVSTAANAVSTIIGLPVNWLVGGIIGVTASGSLEKANSEWKKLLGIILGNVFWLLSGKDRNIQWIMPSAQLLLLVPFFFLSWGIESLVVSNTLDVIHADRISGAVFFANLFSYGLLALVPTFFLIRARKTLLAAIYSARREDPPGREPDSWLPEQLSGMPESQHTMDGDEATTTVPQVDRTQPNGPTRSRCED
jgi:hypothetical protein